MSPKILIAYYSKTGHTERVAKDLAMVLNADLEKIIDQKNRHGLFGYLLGGRDAMKKRLTKIEAPIKDPSIYDLVIIGTPIWGWNITPAVRTYLRDHREVIKRLAFFETSGNTPVAKILPYVKEIISTPIIAAVSFNGLALKKEELYQDKLKIFINQIKQT